MVSILFLLPCIRSELPVAGRVGVWGGVSGGRDVADASAGVGSRGVRSLAIRFSKCLRKIFGNGRNRPLSAIRADSDWI